MGESAGQRRPLLCLGRPEAQLGVGTSLACGCPGLGVITDASAGLRRMTHAAAAVMVENRLGGLLGELGYHEDGYLEGEALRCGEVSSGTC